MVKIDQNVTIIYLCARWHDKIDALILTPYSRKRSHSSPKIGHLPHTYLSETGALVPTLQRSIENLPQIGLSSLLGLICSRYPENHIPFSVAQFRPLGSTPLPRKSQLHNCKNETLRLAYLILKWRRVGAIASVRPSMANFVEQ